MPGSTGGGNSGSFSGGGSHSGGFSGGGNMGGFSGGSHMGGSHIGGGPHMGGSHMGPPPPGMHGGRPPFGGRPSRGGWRLGCGFFPFIFSAVIILSFLVNAGAFTFIGSTIKSFFKDTPTFPPRYEEEVSSDDIGFITREKLPENLCKPTKQIIIDDDDVYPDENNAKLTNALNGLYELTGVQSVVMFRKVNSNTYDPDYGEIDEFMTDTYNELFSDEGHVLFFFAVEQSGVNYNYTNWYICGNDTTGIFDESDAQSVLNSIDSFAEAGHDISFCIYHAFESVHGLLANEFESETPTDADLMTGATENATDGATEKSTAATDETTVAAAEATGETEKSTEKPSEKSPSEENTTEFYHPEVTMPTQTDEGVSAKTVILYVLSLVAVAAVFLTLIGLFKRHAERTKDENYQAHKETSDHSHDNANPYASSGDSSLPVRCPKCGALGALTEDGRCRYCGEKIK